MVGDLSSGAVAKYAVIMMPMPVPGGEVAGRGRRHHTDGGAGEKPWFTTKAPSGSRPGLVIGVHPR